VPEKPRYAAETTTEGLELVRGQLRFPSVGHESAPHGALVRKVFCGGSLAL
jgi:hypothetical protein